MVLPAAAPADAAGGHCADPCSFPRKEAEAEAAVLVSVASLASVASVPSPSRRGRGAQAPPPLLGGGPEAGGGPAPPEAAAEEPPRPKAAEAPCAAAEEPARPRAVAEPCAAAEVLLRSLAEEPYQTVFADPQPRLQGRPGRTGRGIRSFGAAVPGTADVSPQEQCLIRNLDTGEVRPLDPAALTKSFVGEQADPKQLARKTRKPWRSWWSEKKRKDAQLWRAAETGDLAALREALAPTADGAAPTLLDARGPQGRTALHLAALGGLPGAVQALLAAGARADARADGGLAALHLASQRGHREVVRLLLAGGADRCLESDEGDVPLHLASTGGHTDVIVLLLAQDATRQLRVRNHQGQCPAEAAIDVRTALFFSQYERDLQGNDCEAATPSDRYAGRTPYHDGEVLLRNARADQVRRLLARTREPPTESASEESSLWASPKSGSPASSATGTPRVRAPFARVKSDGPELERVGPNSFELVKLLGRGSFGEVFQVRHKRTEQVFAMKVLQKSRVLSSNLLRYAMTERNILAYVRHPYIVYLHYAFQTSSHLVLVLQYCSNGNLQQLISREKRLQEPLARLYTAEILLALCHLHERKTVFRDLKPDNVVIDDKGHALLTDFGLSKEAVAGVRGTKSFVGSVAFLAPEILLKRGHGHTVDIYNLGVLLFDMLTGLPPFYHPDRETLFANIKHLPLKVPDYVPREAKGLICATMEREPSRRLGAGCTAEVQQHVFFAEVDFAALLRREVSPPAPSGSPALGGAWRGEQPASPLRRGGTPESPFDRTADRAAGWLARCARGKDAAPAASKEPVSGWEFAAVPTTESS